MRKDLENDFKIQSKFEDSQFRTLLCGLTETLLYYEGQLLKDKLVELRDE